MLKDQPSLFGEEPHDDENGARETVGVGEDAITDTDEVFGLAKATFAHNASDSGEKRFPILDAIRQKRQEKAAERGLAARWANYKKAKGFVSVHDPTTGGWHDLPWKEAPGWAKWEATKRSEIYRNTGDAGAFDLTASQMREIWEREHPLDETEDEGIGEEYELPED